MALVTIRGNERAARSGFAFRPACERLEDRTVPSSLQSRIPPDITGVDPNSGVNASIDILGASEDGQYIIFQSQATNLVPNQISPPFETNIFWRDVFTNDTRLVSRYAIDPTNGVPPGFVKSLGAAQSVINPGPGKQVSYTAVLSERGTKVAFISNGPAYLFDPSLLNSQPSKLAADGGGDDVFLWESGAGQDGGTAERISLISRNKNGAALGKYGGISSPSIGYYGESVSFVSNAPYDNIFTQTLVDKLAGVAYPNKGQPLAQYIGPVDPLTLTPLPGTVFVVPGQPNPPDYPIRDDTIGTSSHPTTDFGPDIFRVSFVNNVPQTPEPITFTAKPVTFVMLETINNVKLRVVREFTRLFMDGDIQVDGLNRYATLGESSYVAIRTSKQDAYKYSYDQPRFIVDPNNTNISTTNGTPVFQTLAGTSPGVTGTGVTDNVIISRSSGDALFTYQTKAAAGNLVTGYTNNNLGGFDLYRAPLSVGASGQPKVELITAAVGTANSGGNGILDIDPRAYQITGNGAKVLFTSKSTNLVSGIADVSPTSKTKGTYDIFQRDALGAVTTVISITDANPFQTGDGDSRFPTQTPDSLVIGYESTAKNLTEVPDVNGAATDVFVRDVFLQDTLVASSLTGNTQTGNARSYNLVVVRTNPIDTSFYRNFVAFFVSDATNLDPDNPALPVLGQLYQEKFPIFLSPLSRIVSYSGGTSGFVAIATTDKLGHLVEVNRFLPFPGYSGEIRVATGDFNGDGTPDVAVGGGPGAGPRVKIVDGFTLRTIDDFFAYESTFTGGVYVAAGDMDRDGTDELIIGAGERGGPRVQILNVGTGLLEFDGFAYEPTSRTGVRVAAGDFNGDGFPDLFIAAGEGGGPRVRIFSGASLPQQKVLADFFAFESSQRGGAFITAGDYNGDGLSDIGVGGGPGGGPRVTVFNAANVVLQDPNQPIKFVDFFAFPPTSTEGARVAIRNINGSRFGGLIVGTGSGFPKIRTFTGNNPTDGNGVLQAQELVPFDELVGRFGAWVG